MASGIYCIENMINGKKYIGQSFNVKLRMGKNHKEIILLNLALNEYGKENFKRWVLIYCEKNELNRLEIESIRIFRSHVSDGGYNISRGGKASGMTGKNHSEDTIKKMSASATGRKNTRPNYRHTKETIEKIRESNKHPHPTVNMKGGNNPAFGTHHTEKWKVEMSKRMCGRMPFNFGKKMPGATSQCFGVCIEVLKTGNIRWRPSLHVNKKLVHLGSYKNEIVAAKVYDKYVVEHNLPNPLNFPEEWDR